MKIGDIIARKDQQQDIGFGEQPQQQQKITEAEIIRKQREDIERDLAMVNQQPQQQNYIQQPKMQQPVQQNYIQQPQQQNYIQQEQEIETEPETEPTSQKQKYRINIILDNGQKLPILFTCYPFEVADIIDKIELKIEAGRVIDIGGFRIPGNKIMYIDLSGK